MKFGAQIRDQAVKEWQDKYINYKKLKKTIKRKPEIFLEILNSEVEEANSFFTHNMERTTNKIKELKVNIEIYRKMKEESKNRKRKVTTNPGNIKKSVQAGVKFMRRDSAPPSITLDEEHHAIAIPPLNYTTNEFKSLLNDALLENYRYLELLKNFKILNSICVYKALKKYDKKMEKSISAAYMEKCKEYPLFSSTLVEDLVIETEELYILFSNKSRKSAMKKLRLPEQSHKSDIFVTWRCGLFLGLSIPAIIETIYNISINNLAVQPENKFSILNIYAGLSIPIFFLFIFAGDILIWTQKRINYVFIFEFDPRNYLSPSEFNEIGSFLLLLLSYMMNCHLLGKIDFANSHTLYYFLILYLMLLMLIFTPVNIFYKSSRVWMIKTVGRLMFSGFIPVQFRDFFLGDLTASMVYFLVSLETLFCSLSHEFKNLDQECYIGTSWAAPFVASLPSYWRLMQCLRRWNDSGDATPHLNNALKYILTLAVIWISAASVIYNSPQIRTVWIVFAVISATYSNYWDIFFDWGLCSNGKILRDKLIYPPIFYYVSMTTNICFRFSWTLLISPNQWGSAAPSVIFSLAVLEVLRRFVWNLFRMENEMINNIGAFRAVRDIPLPFNTGKRRNNDEEQEEEEEKEDSIDEGKDEAEIGRRSADGGDSISSASPDSIEIQKSSKAKKKPRAKKKSGGSSND